MTPYGKMTREELERQYSPSSCIDDVMVYIRKYRDQSKAAYDQLHAHCHKDIKYGPEGRSTLDIFVPDGPGPFPVHVFIHGGYWQELSKAESSFAAPNFLDHDIIFIALDYTLAPDASLFQIVEQVKHGVLWILDNCDDYCGNKNNITLSGSSAGAHLVAEVIAMDWPEKGYNGCPLKGACEVSGIYDLRPLVGTYVNDPLAMTDEDARDLSPLLHIPGQGCPAIFSYGGNETDEFKRQTQDYQQAWQKAGHDATYVAMPAFNHFDIILELNNQNSPLFQAVLTQIRPIP